MLSVGLEEYGFLLGVLHIALVVICRPGVDYLFTVTVSKGVIGGLAWAAFRSDNASCIVSTSAEDVPHASITPKV